MTYGIQVEVTFFPWFLKYITQRMCLASGITTSAPVGSFAEQRKLVECARQMRGRAARQISPEDSRYQMNTTTMCGTLSLPFPKGHWQRILRCVGDVSNRRAARNLGGTLTARGRSRCTFSQDKRYRWNCPAQTNTRLYKQNEHFDLPARDATWTLSHY